MSKTAKAVKNEIAAITRVYEGKLFDVIDAARREIVLPFCQRKKYNFLVGLTTYGFVHAGVRHASSPAVPYDRIPKTVRYLLDSAYPLEPDSNLGLFMRPYDYRPQVGDKAVVTERQWLSMKHRVQAGGIKKLSEDYINKLQLYVGKVGTITHVFPGAITLRYTKDTAFHVQVTDYTIY